MKVGQPVWHVVTGPDCIGVVKELKSWRPDKSAISNSDSPLPEELWYALVHWLPGCDAEICLGNSEEPDEWHEIKYLRKVGEPE